MSEKQFIIGNDKLYCDDGVFVADLNLKIGQSVVINLLNNYEIENNKLTQKIKDKNKYQRTLEAKIRRLKDRIKVLEKKMSEQRFERWNDFCCKVKDNQEDTLLRWKDVVQKLNEQQATISALKEENEQLRKDKEILKERLRECRIKMDKFNCR